MLSKTHQATSMSTPKLIYTMCPIAHNRIGMYANFASLLLITFSMHYFFLPPFLVVVLTVPVVGLAGGFTLPMVQIFRFMIINVSKLTINLENQNFSLFAKPFPVFQILLNGATS